MIRDLRARKDINLVVVDEGSMFRNASTQKWKALASLLRPDHRVWWLTGTPCPNAPTDAWSQAKIICPENVTTHFGSFKRATMAQISQFKWAPKAGSSEIAFEAMQPAVRFKKKECLDLPPVTTVDRAATLTKEQIAAFNEMKAEMQAEMKGRQITAVNAADKLGKLRQILCGAIKDPELDDYVSIPHQPRLDVTLEAIEQASAKVLIVVPFKGIIQVLAKEIAKFHTVGVLNGDVSIRARNQIISDFKNTPDPHTLLCHPKVMSHGLNLTEADTLVVYAPIYSNDEFEQLKERFNRAGQTRKMTIVRIGAHPLEWEIYRLLDTRRVSQEGILDLYKSVTE
jgi:SNF2 family DNA or RNA helicase